MKNPILFLITVSIFAPGYGQVEYNAIQIYGHEEGAAVITLSQWQVVSKTLYTSMAGFFDQPVPAGHTREYYVGIRKADNINDCSIPGSKFRFWFTWNEIAGHEFNVGRDWGLLDEGTMGWIKVPTINEQATTRGITSTKYWRLEAKIPSSCPGSTMKIFGIWLKALDIPGGSSPAVALNNDGAATLPDYRLGGPGGYLTVNQEQLEVFGTGGIQLTASNSSDDYMLIQPNIDVSALNPGMSTISARITNRHLGHLVVDIGANDGADSFAIRTDSNLDGQVDKLALIVKPSGNVLVGKTSQSNPNYTLDIGGKVRADEVVVNTTGADYVFEEGYDLKTLQEVENFIRENGHLPGIPSAAAMQKEGMAVGELNTKLLEKVEELMLYLLSQQRIIDNHVLRLDSLERHLEKHVNQ